MRSRSYLFLLLVLGLALLSGLGYNVRKYNLGLDIQGGVRLVYEMDVSKLTTDQRQDIATMRQQILHTLTQRVNGEFGTTEGTVNQKGDYQFIIELPGFTDIDAAMKMLGTSARIEFYGARTVVSPRNSYARYEVEKDDKSTDPAVSFRLRTGGGDLISYMIPDPADPKHRQMRNPKYDEIVKSWGEPILAGNDLADAQIDLNMSTPRPLMKFSSEGSVKMEKWSRANPQGNIAAVLDGKVLSLNPVAPDTVLKDNAVINGTMDAEYVKSLVELLKSGALPVDLKIQSQETVDPTIGKVALDKIIFAGAIAFGVISLFMVVYYAFPGIIAVVALTLYVLFTLTVLKLINATFSLAAIAGFILSVGMAVDANILIFERFKEEEKKGRGLEKAIELGFSRALPAIIDSNSCTILTSFVLMQLGTGPVKGFATTLVIGVFISLFTAVFVTRSLLVFAFGSGLATNEKWYAINRNWFGEKFEAHADTDPLPVVQKSKRWFMISLLTIIPGLIFVGIGGLKPNVEFLGGSEITYSVRDANVSSTTIAAKLESANMKGGNVKFGSGKDGEKIAYITLPPTAGLKGLQESQIKEKISTATGLDQADYKGYTEIGPTVQKETLRNAIMGVIVSSILIIVFLAIRFGVSLGNFVAGLRFGVSAIIALVHDILVVIGLAAIVGYLVGWEVSALFITAMLTIIGFSVHDTIVIFDRIRENLRRPQQGETFEHLVNRSITRSFARSINTSMTVIVTLAIIFFAGTATPDLKFFVFAMLVGILSGTYSSIYNASPILYLWDKAIEKKKGRAATLVGLAIAEAQKAQVISTRPVSVADPVVDKAKQYGQVRRRASDAGKKRTDDEE